MAISNITITTEPRFSGSDVPGLLAMTVADQDIAFAARRAAARRTALIVAGLASAVYAGFMLLNVMAK
jgi:hypothetical protein